MSEVIMQVLDKTAKQTNYCLAQIPFEGVICSNTIL